MRWERGCGRRRGVGGLGEWPCVGDIWHFVVYFLRELFGGVSHLEEFFESRLGGTGKW